VPLKPWKAGQLELPGVLKLEVWSESSMSVDALCSAHGMKSGRVAGEVRLPGLAALAQSAGPGDPTARRAFGVRDVLGFAGAWCGLESLGLGFGWIDLDLVEFATLLDAEIVGFWCCHLAGVL
jgi:hypothetical protein